MTSAASSSALLKSRSDGSSEPATMKTDSAHEKTNHEWQTPENADFVHPDHMVPPSSQPGADNLTIVCCHAIFLPDAKNPEFPLRSPHYEPNWLLVPFQKSDDATGKPGEHETFLAHVKSGLDALTIGTDAENPPKSLLVLSGGVTQRSRTTMSEARSYYHAVLGEELAEGHLHGGRAHHMFSKGYILLEEHATDSYQNLLFSILLFRQKTGKYPKHIRVITHAFKAKRFLELHAPAIRWPEARIQVQGMDPVMSSTELESTLRGEEQHGYAPWTKDPLGTGEVLAEKRKQRGWHDSVIDQLSEGLEPSVKELLRGHVPEQLPWDPKEVTA